MPPLVLVHSSERVTDFPNIAARDFLPGILVRISRLKGWLVGRDILAGQSKNCVAPAQVEARFTSS